MDDPVELSLDSGDAVEDLLGKPEKAGLAAVGAGMVTVVVVVVTGVVAAVVGAESAKSGDEHNKVAN